MMRGSQREVVFAYHPPSAGMSLDRNDDSSEGDDEDLLNDSSTFTITELSMVIDVIVQRLCGV